MGLDPYLVLLAMALIGAIFTERRRRRRRSPARRTPLQTARPVDGFFAAREDEVEGSLVDNGPAGRFPGVTAGRIGGIELARLGRIIVAGEFDELVAAIRATERAGRSGAVLVPVPPPIRDRLSSFDLRSSAERWSDTPELRRAGWTYADAVSVLAHLRALVAETPAGATLWLWRPGPGSDPGPV